MKKFLFSLIFIMTLVITLPIGQNDISIAGEDDGVEWNSYETENNLP